MKWPWKHFILLIRYQRLTGVIETYLGWAASWNSGRWKSPSNALSAAERRQTSWDIWNFPLCQVPQLKWWHPLVPLQKPKSVLLNNHLNEIEFYPKFYGHITSGENETSHCLKSRDIVFVPSWQGRGESILWKITMLI